MNFRYGNLLTGTLCTTIADLYNAANVTIFIFHLSFTSCKNRHNH